jgi:hypothetical protein
MSFIIGSFEEGVFVYPEYARDWVFAWAMSKQYDFIGTQKVGFTCLNVKPPKKDVPYYKMSLITKEEDFKLLFTLDSFEELLTAVEAVDLEEQPSVGINKYKLVFIPMEGYTFVTCEEMYKSVLDTLYSYENKIKQDKTQIMVENIEKLLEQDTTD